MSDANLNDPRIAADYDLIYANRGHRDLTPVQPS